MAQDIGTVYVQVKPSGKDFGKTLEGQITPSIDKAGAKGSTSLTSQLGSAFGKIGKIGLGTITTITGGIVALAAKGGFDRALNIENAKAKLKGLGHDSASVTEIMNDALASVKGTAFGLGDAATVAASLSASGVKQGGQLTNVLKTVADTAQISGRSLTDIGTIFGSVAARGKLQGDDMLQLMSSGIPVLQMLGKHLGKTSGDISTMVSKGQIDFQTFADAMQEGMGGAALSAGTTFTGALANVKAALSRLGEQVATPILDGLRGLFNQAIPLIDGFTAAATPIMQKVGASLQSGLENALPSIQRFAGKFTALFQPLVQPVKVLWEQIGFVFDQIGEYGMDMASSLETIFGGLIRIIGDLTGSLGYALRELTSYSAISAIASTVATALRLLGDAVKFVADNMDWIKPLATGIAGIILASKGLEVVSTGLNNVFKGAEGVKNVAEGVTDFINGLNGVRTLGLIGALKKLSGGMTLVKDAQLAWSAVTKAATAIQVAFQAVMATTLGPIALIAAAITAVTALAVWFFTQTEVGRKAWSEFTSWLVSAWQSVSSAAVGIWNGLGSFFSGLWSSITSATSSAWNGFASSLTGAWRATVSTASGVWSGLTSFFSGLWSGITNGVSTAWDAVVSVFTSVASTIGGIMANIVTVIGAVPVWIGQQLLSGINGLFSSLINLLTGWASNSTGIVHTLLEGIIAYITTVWTVLSGIVSTGVNLIRTIVVAIVDLLQGDWQGAWTAISGFFQDTWNGIVAFFTPIITWLQSIVTTVMSTLQSAWVTAWSAISGFFSGVWAGIVAVATAMGEALSAVITNAVNWVSGVWNTVWSGIAAFFSGAWNGIVGFAGPILSTLGGIITGAVNWISGIWNSAWSGISGFFGGIWNNMVGMASSAVNAIGGVIGRIYGIVSGALAGAGHWLYDVGRNIISGLIGGITGAFGWLKDTITSMGSNALSWAKNVLGIHSPSKVFREQVGVMIGRGMAQGIDDSSDYVTRSLNEIAGGLSLDGQSFGMPKFDASGAYLPSQDAGLLDSKRNDVNVSIDARGTDPDVLFAMFGSRTKAAVDRWG